MIKIPAKEITGTPVKKLQRKWFEQNGFRYATDTQGEVFTTDDWMNLKDKGHTQANDDGFDLSSLDLAEPNEWFDKMIHSLTTSRKMIFHNEEFKSEKVNEGAVYFLFKNRRLVYVGQCENLRKRLNNHSHYAKVEFDDFRTLKGVPKNAFRHVEAYYIHLFKPEFNDHYPKLCKTAQKLVKRLK